MLLAVILSIITIDISQACQPANQGRCYGDLGCFPITSDFIHPYYRPVNVDPETPEEVNTTFHLFTKENVQKGQLLDRRDPETIRKSNYNPSKETEFLIHGWHSTMEKMEDITKEILRFKDINVINVDWSGGAQTHAKNQDQISSYVKASANARLAGREIGNFIKLLLDDFQTKPEDFNLIGHSLGAQVAGYAGQWLNDTKVGEITGLDPAGPLFEGMPPSIRLDPTDGKFVNVLHTNAHKSPYTSFGIYEPSGHVDFYPDGGYVVNDCKNPSQLIKLRFKDIVSGASDFVYCSHDKALDMYKESISHNCLYTAFKCDDIKTFKEAKCYKCDRPGYDCRPMGYYTDQFPYDGLENEKFFLTTTEDKPHLCAFHWVLEITFSDQQKEVSGNLYGAAIGEKHNVTKHKLSKSTETFSGGKTYNYLLTFEKDPARIRALQLSWKKSATNPIEENNLKIRDINAIPIEIIDKQERDDQSQKFCDPVLQDIEPNKVVTANARSDCKMK